MVFFVDYLKKFKEVRNYFSSLDNFLAKWDLLTIKGKWQLLLDQNNLPASKTPWGNLTAIDVNSGKINWRISFGQRKIRNSPEIGPGDINFGGVEIIER